MICTLCMNICGHSSNANACFQYIFFMVYLVLVNVALKRNMVKQIWVHIGSCNGLLHDSTTPLPELT